MAKVNTFFSTKIKNIVQVIFYEYHPKSGYKIGIDEVLEKHNLEIIDPKVGGIAKESFIKANEIVLPEVEQKLENGKIVIFDACFYHQEPIEHLIKNLPYEHFVFTLKAPVETCVARDAGRDKNHGEDAARAVHNLVSRFDYGIGINTENKTAEETTKEIFNHLPYK